MHIRPILIIDGQDESRYFISCHAEMTGNSTKDPGKFDIMLANPGGRYMGRFAPKNIEQLDKEQMELLNTEGPVDFTLAPKKRVGLKIAVSKYGCEGESEKIISIFSGEVQKAEATETHLMIEGSCSEGGMTARINPKIYKSDYSITAIVNDLLDDFGGVPMEKRHIHPYKDSVDDVNPSLDQAIDFDTALYEVSQWAQSIYFFDENDDFWFVPATDMKGFSDLNGKVLRGSNASNMVGYCNILRVYGGTIDSSSDGTEPVNERKTHSLIFAEARAPDWEIQHRGEMVAPIVIVPNASQARCQEIANNLLEWYRQFQDVPTVKVSGVAPGLLSKVRYKPWNGSMPPVSCGGEEEILTDNIEGLVTRRVVDISAEGGFVASLDVTTNFLGVNVPDGYEKLMNFQAVRRAGLDADPGIDENSRYAGVTFA